MRKLILLIPFFIATQAFAGTMSVVTGYGYITDGNGNIIAKEQLSPGVHPLTDGYKYLEVSNKAALDAITVALPPETPMQQQEALNAQALQEVIANQIANDPKLSAQQAAITKSLNASQAQTK